MNAATDAEDAMSRAWTEAIKPAENYWVPKAIDTEAGKELMLY